MFNVYAYSQLVAQCAHSSQLNGSLHRLPSCSSPQAYYENQKKVASLLYLALVAHVALFIWALGRNGWDIEGLEAQPLFGFDATAARHVGAMSTRAIRVRLDWWRMLTGKGEVEGV